MKLLKPLHFDKIWGYEDWIASTHKDGAQSELVKAAGDFPLLVKIIQADSTLSVQIHPDDKTAIELEGAGSRGKTECWYVLDAAPDTKLVYGFKEDYSIEEIKKAIDAGKIERLLKVVQVKKGDFVFIPAGTVHAIGGGLRLLEVQQSCNITYRFYDWGRGRELHIDKGLKSIKSSVQIKRDLGTSAIMDGEIFDLSRISPFGSSSDCKCFSYFRCEYFSIERISLTKSNSSELFIRERPELFFILNASPDFTVSYSDRQGKKSKEMPALSEQIYVGEPHETVYFHGEGTLLRINAN